MSILEAIIGDLKGKIPFGDINIVGQNLEITLTEDEIERIFNEGLRRSSSMFKNVNAKVKIINNQVKIIFKVI